MPPIRGNTQELRGRARAAVQALYRQAGQAPRVPCLWFDSLPATDIGYRVLASGRVPSEPWCLYHDSHDPQTLREVWGRLQESWQRILEVRSATGDAPGHCIRRRLERALGRLNPHWRASLAKLRQQSPLSALPGQPPDFPLEPPGSAFERASRDHEPNGLRTYVDVARAALYWRPFERVVLLCGRPVEDHTRDGVLHRDGGPAVRWRDGFRHWLLRGVPLPRHIAETPAQTLDAQCLRQERHPDVMREIVHKIGIERICRDLGAKCIDRQGDYELLDLGLFAWGPQTYLKMRNPSLGTYHIEGVHPACNTVPKALAWRNQSSSSPAELT